ncbi:MAG: hypothetical protein WC071_13685, partial [Victivallaceae bacterium]
FARVNAQQKSMACLAFPFCKSKRTIPPFKSGSCAFTFSIDLNKNIGILWSGIVVQGKKKELYSSSFMRNVPEKLLFLFGENRADFRLATFKI